MEVLADSAMMFNTHGLAYMQKNGDAASNMADCDQGKLPLALQLLCNCSRFTCFVKI